MCAGVCMCVSYCTVSVCVPICACVYVRLNSIVSVCVCVCVCVRLNPFLPPRAKFLKQLVRLVGERDGVLASTGLPTQTQERRERLGTLVLPGTEENLPGVHLEDLG